MAPPPVLALPPRLDVTEANDLLAFLLATRGQAAQIKVAALRRFDLPLLQLLLMAVRDRQICGGALGLCGVSPAQEQRLQRLGMDHSLLPRQLAEAAA